MPSELSIRAVHQEGLRFAVTAREHTVVTDYPLQPGNEGAGMRPLELLLTSLASCLGGSMAVLMRKLGQLFTGLEVSAKGLRRDEHPTLFTQIEMEVVVRGTNLDAALVRQALAQSDTTLCPVWAMLKPGTNITSTLRIVEE